MRRFGLVIAVVGGIAISLIGVLWPLLLILGQTRPAPLLPDAPLQRLYALERGQAELVIHGLLFYVTMLAGIILGQLFQAVIAKPDKQVRVRELLRTLNTGRSWAAMLASPIVFFSTAPSLLALGGGLVAFFYALQNGFFCLTVFNGISAKFTSSTKAA